MKLKQLLYSRTLSLKSRKAKEKLGLNQDALFSNEMRKTDIKIFQIISSQIKPKINKKFTYYSKQLSQSRSKVNKLKSKYLKEENKKYLKRIFSYERVAPDYNIFPKTMNIELPVIEIKNKSKKDFDISSKKHPVKKVKKFKINEGIKQIIPKKGEIKIKKVEILNEIIMKSFEEQNAEDELKKIEEKEIKKELEEKNKLKEAIDGQNIKLQNLILEKKEKNKLKMVENKRKLELFQKEQKIINKKSSDEKKKILNIDINNIKNKEEKRKILQELDLLIRHGAQLSLEIQSKLSNEIINYDNITFDFFLNIINSMISADSNFNSYLLINLIKSLNENKNLNEKTYGKALSTIIQLNKEIGIIDGSENLFWENLSNKKFFSLSLKGLQYLIQNSYGFNDETKINNLIDIINNNYLNSEDLNKDILCNIIKNISIKFNKIFK